MRARWRGRELGEWTEERNKAERGGEKEREGEAAEAFIYRTKSFKEDQIVGDGNKGLSKREARTGGLEIRAPPAPPRGRQDRVPMSCV